MKNHGTKPLSGSKNVNNKADAGVPHLEDQTWARSTRASSNKREREDNSNKQQRHKHNNDGGRFFVPIRDVDYNRGRGSGIVIRHPPVNRGGGGKAGTGVVK